MENNTTPPLRNAGASEIPATSRNLDESTPAPLPTPPLSPRSSQSVPLSPSSTSSSSKIAQPSKLKSPSKVLKWKSKWITDWWGLELACWVIAALSLVGMIITLESYKHKPPPEWPFGLTLNSLISIFASISQMAMMKPVIECISQLKWLWFVRREQILDFQALDDASRGPTGSLILLGKIRGPHLVSLGAAITIIAVGFSTFAQQVVTYPLSLRPDGVAKAPQVFNLTVTTNTGTGSDAIGAAVYQGYAQSNLNLSDVAPICNTGNCTWPQYKSLGICASVEDVSSTIIYSACNSTAFEDIFKIAGTANPGYPCFNYTLPDIVIATGSAGPGSANASLSNGVLNASLIEETGMMQVMSLTASLANSSSLLTAYLMYQPDFLASVNSPLSSPIAYRLNLDFCVQTFNTTVSNGEVNTKVLSNYILPVASEGLYSPSNTSFGNDGFVSLGNDTFGSSALASGQLNWNLLQAFDTACFYVIPSAVDNSFINLNGMSFCSFSNPLFDAVSNSTDPLRAVTESLGNSAISMTNAFRMGLDGMTQTGLVDGTAFSPVVLVETNYLWLLLPISLVGLMLIFLLATILKSERLGARTWKSSNLATLQGLDLGLHTKLGGLSSITKMEDEAKDVKVQFDGTSDVLEHHVEYKLVESRQKKY